MIIKIRLFIIDFVKEEIIMKKRRSSNALDILAFPTVIMICLSILLSGCNTIKESTTLGDLSSVICESTESSEGSETSNISSETTPSTSRETEASVTYLSFSVPGGLTREEMYWDVGQELLLGWSRLYYLDIDRHVYIREYTELNETMMLEMVLESRLYQSNIAGARPNVFENCHCVGRNLIDYTILAMSFLFGQEISENQIEELLSRSSNEFYSIYYDDTADSLHNEVVDIREIGAEITDTNVAEDNYDFVPDCSILSSDDTSCTYDVYWVPGSSGEHLPNGRFAPVRDIATITVTFDFDDSYDLGFIITDIQVERAPWQ